MYIVACFIFYALYFNKNLLTIREPKTRPISVVQITFAELPKINNTHRYKKR